MAPVHLNATQTRPEWQAGELHLWGDELVVIFGPVADIRALLSRALDLETPTESE